MNEPLLLFHWWLGLISADPLISVRRYYYRLAAYFSYLNIHSDSSIRGTLVETPLLSVKKIGNNSLFSRKNKGQNSISLALLWVFMLWDHVILSRRCISSMKISDRSVVTDFGV